MRIRIDFRLILPGLLIFLIGLAFFLLWLVLAVVSFFLFFNPALHGIFYVVLDLLLASLVLMAVGVLIALSGARGWWGAWSTSARAAPPMTDRLKTSERVGEFFGIIISLLILGYFYQSQVLATGFFTPAFGQAEQLAFYAPMVLGIAVSLVRGVWGRKRATRPLQSLQGGVLAVSAFWLLQVFPFEFTHLTALLPTAVQLPFWWVSNPIGQLLFLLGGIGGFVSMVVHAAKYVSER